jgi:hypothetical protein
VLQQIQQGNLIKSLKDSTKMAPKKPTAEQQSQTSLASQVVSMQDQVSQIEARRQAIGDSDEEDDQGSWSD